MHSRPVRGPLPNFSEAIVDEEALELLKAHEEIDPRSYTARSDGRFTLRVSHKLRADWDSLVVKTGLDHAGVIKAIYGGRLNSKGGSDVRRKRLE